MRYANITSIPSSYIVAFFSSLGDASPPGEDASPLAEEYENPSHLLVIPLVLTLFNTPPNLIYFCFILLHDNKYLCVNNQYTKAFFANQTKTKY